MKKIVKRLKTFYSIGMSNINALPDAYNNMCSLTRTPNEPNSM